VVSLCVVGWILLRTSIRRLHDLDKHPALLLLGLIPIVGIALGLYLALAPGTVDSNQHGPPPPHRLSERSVDRISDPDGPNDSSAVTQNDLALRRFVIGVLVIVALVAGGLVGTRLNRVDTAEYEVLERFIAPVVDSAGFTTTSIERGDPSPCWWWCEDYVLDVDIRMRIQPKQDIDNAADSCAVLRAHISESLRRPPDSETERPSGTCSMHWFDLQADGRDVSLWASSRLLPSMGADLVVTNESVDRAFLPQCALAC